MTETGQVLRAGATAVGIYVLPWVLAVVGWSFTSLADPPMVVERFEAPVGMLLELDLDDDGVAELDGEGDDEVEQEGRDDPTPDVPLDAMPSRPGHQGTADADDRPGGGVAMAAVADGAPVAGAGGTGEPGDGAGELAGRVQKRRRPSRCKDPHPHVRIAQDGIVEIDRSLVDEYTRNLESFMKLGYSRPYDEEGVKGWYISGFSCSSPVHHAGFRRGDVLLTINGKKTRTWVGVFLMYQKLKKKDAFEVSLLRKGEPQTLAFRVVD